MIIDFPSSSDAANANRLAISWPFKFQLCRDIAGCCAAPLRSRRALSCPSLAPGQQNSTHGHVLNFTSRYISRRNGGFTSCRKLTSCLVLHVRTLQRREDARFEGTLQPWRTVTLFCTTARALPKKNLSTIKARYSHAKGHTSTILQWLRMEPRRRRPLGKSLSFTRLSSMSHGTTHTSPSASWDAISRLLTETLLKEPGW